MGMPLAAGRAPLRRERRAGHGRARGDLPRRRRDRRDGAEDRASSSASSARPAGSRSSATRSTTSCALLAPPGTPRDPARPHLVRQHGAGLLPARAARSRRSSASRPSSTGCCSPARSTSRRSRRSSTPATPTRLRLLPRLCVSSEGAVDSIQLVTRMPLGRVHSVAVTPESATSVVLTKVLLPQRRASCRSARRPTRSS